MAGAAAPRPLGRLQGAARPRPAGRAVRVDQRVRARQLGPGLDEARVEGDGLLVEGDRRSERHEVRVTHALRLGFPLEEGVVGRGVAGGPLRQRGALRRAQRHVQRLGHLAGHVGLDLEHVGERGVERLLPLGRAGRDLDQLGTHPHVVAAGALLPPNRAGQQPVHPELAADLLGRLGGLLVLGRAAAGGHLEPGERGQLAPHLVGDPVGEVLVVRAAQVLEGEHREPLGAARVGGVVPVPQPAEQHAEPDQETQRERARGDRDPPAEASVWRRASRGDAAPVAPEAAVALALDAAPAAAPGRTGPARRTGPPRPARAPSGWPRPPPPGHVGPDRSHARRAARSAAWRRSPARWRRSRAPRPASISYSTEPRE